MKRPVIASEIIENRWVVGAVVCIGCVGYVAVGLFDGWIPHVDGAAAYAAERTLHGELPHVDFESPDPGALTLINALGMKLFGVSLRSLRITSAFFALFFAIGCYWIAVQVSSPPAAAFITALCVVWGEPSRLISPGIWHVMLFSIYGTGVWLRYLRSRRPMHLVAVGILAGLSGFFFFPLEQFVSFLDSSWEPAALATIALWLACFMIPPIKNRHLQAVFFAILSALLSFVLYYGFVPGIYRAVWQSTAPLSLLWAPVLILGVFYFLKTRPRPVPGRFLIVGVFYLAFGLLWMGRGDPSFIGQRYLQYPYEPLAIERAGISVPRHQKAVYEGLVGFIAERGGASAKIFAGPRCPEVYFLSGAEHRTKIDNADVVILCGPAQRSGPTLTATFAPLPRRYENYKQIGWFSAYYRD